MPDMPVALYTLLSLAIISAVGWGADTPVQSDQPELAAVRQAGTARVLSLQLVGGGQSAEDPRVAVGGSGNIFLAGTTSSVTWPVSRPAHCAFAPAGSCAHAFLIKMSPAGDHVYYSLRLGGSRTEHLTELAVDAGGDAYLTGTTDSPDFPTVHPLQSHCRGLHGSGCADGFVVKVDPRGRLVYSTFLGGSNDDDPAAIAVDQQGEAFVAGTTSSTDFPLVRATQARLRGPTDGFVARIAAGGQSILYSTYLGGCRDDQITGIAVDRLGEAYVTGSTLSPDFRTSHSLQPHFVGGICVMSRCTDAFLVKLGAAGRFLAGTFLGSSAADGGNAVAVDQTGDAYVTGYTGSSTFLGSTLVGSAGKVLCGANGDVAPCDAAFVVEVSPWLDHLAYGMLLSGNQQDTGNAVAVNAQGAAVIGGFTESTDFPTVAPTQPQSGGGVCSVGKGDTAPCDGFLTVIAPGGKRVTFSTYIGGNGEDTIQAVVLNARGDAIVAGSTWSGNLARMDSPPSLAPRVFVAWITDVAASAQTYAVGKFSPIITSIGVELGSGCCSSWAPRMRCRRRAV